MSNKRLIEQYVTGTRIDNMPDDQFITSVNTAIAVLESHDYHVKLYSRRRRADNMKHISKRPLKKRWLQLPCTNIW